MIASTAGGGIAFTFGLAAVGTFAAAFRCGFAAGAAFTAAGRFSALALILRAFFAAVFFFVFIGFVFEIFAPALARLSVFRPGDGLAAAGFFGFFMITILANGARLLSQSTPGISEAQSLFNFWTESGGLVRAGRVRS